MGQKKVLRQVKLPALGMVALVLFIITACAGDVPMPTSPPAATSVPITQPATGPIGGPTPVPPALDALPPVTAQPATQVRGMILEVTARSLTEIALLRLRDAQGREWSFTTLGYAEITPSHLREHQVLGQSVLVHYVERDGQLVALAILD